MTTIFINNTAIAQHLHKTQHQLGTGSATHLNEIVHSLITYYIDNPTQIIVQMSCEALPVHHTVIAKYCKEKGMHAPQRRVVVNFVGQVLTQLLFVSQRFSQRGIILPADLDQAYDCIKNLLHGVRLAEPPKAPVKKKIVSKVTQMESNPSQ